MAKTLPDAITRLVSLSEDNCNDDDTCENDDDTCTHTYMHDDDEDDDKVMMMMRMMTMMMTR